MAPLLLVTIPVGLVAIRRSWRTERLMSKVALFAAALLYMGQCAAAVQRVGRAATDDGESRKAICASSACAG